MPFVTYESLQCSYDLASFYGVEECSVDGSARNWVIVKTHGFVYLSNALNTVTIQTNFRSCGLPLAILEAEEKITGRYSGYKLRLNINIEDVPKAYEIIFDILPPTNFPICMKMTDPMAIKIAKKSYKNPRLTYGGQFTIYIHNPNTITGNPITEQSQQTFYLNLRRELNLIFKKWNIRPGRCPSTDFQIDGYMSGRVDFRPEDTDIGRRRTNIESHCQDDRYISSNLEGRLKLFWGGYNSKVLLFQILRQDAGYFSSDPLYARLSPSPYGGNC